MKNYRIKVNGVAYDVAVEELGAGEASAAPVSTPAAVPAPAKKAAPKTSTLAITPSCAAQISFSIFIASNTRTASPFFTEAPACAFTATILPGIGAVIFTAPALPEVFGDMVEGGDVLATMN